MIISCFYGRLFFTTWSISTESLYHFLSFRYTLKLRTRAQYKVCIEVEAGKKVLYLKLGGIQWDQFLCQPGSDDNTNRLDFAFIWCTDKMQSTRNKYRTLLPCVLKLKDHEEVHFVAMVKFYSEDKVSHSKGCPLSFISVDDSEGNARRRGCDPHQLLFNQVTSQQS